MKKRACYNLRESTINLVKKYAKEDDMSESFIVEEAILFRLKYREFKLLKQNIENDSEKSTIDWFNDFWDSAKKEVK